MTKKIFIVTGEHSGDIHAANVVKELKKLIPDIEIAGVGGESMKAEGVQLIHDHSGMSVIGIDSFKKIPEHILLGKKILNFLKNDFHADIILLIDYGGFNLRLSKYLKKENYKVFYYISPQIWASRRGRLKKIVKYIDKMMLIFPFEEEIHRKAGVNAEFVGHPLVNQMPKPLSKHDFCKEYSLNPNKPIIGLFPGSRKSEISFLMDIFLESASLISNEIPNAQFCIAKSVNIKDELINNYIAKYKNIKFTVVNNANYKLLSASDFLILKSGTVTLEAAIYNKPMLISYKSYWIAYWIYLLIRYLKVLGLPNIIAGKTVVPELLQNSAKPDLIAQKALQLINSTDERTKMLEELSKISKMLTQQNASENVAKILYKELCK